LEAQFRFAVLSHEQDVDEIRGVRNVHCGECCSNCSNWFAEFSASINERPIEERETVVEFRI
jgi:hypothetical protein